MNLLIINLFDLLILAHLVDWFFTARPIQNPVTGFIHAVCTPLNRILSQNMQLTIRGNTVAPAALSILSIAFVRLAVSALY